jgi:hypothetical protein
VSFVYFIKSPDAAIPFCEILRLAVDARSGIEAAGFTEEQKMIWDEAHNVAPKEITPKTEELGEKAAGGALQVHIRDGSPAHRKFGISDH